MPMSDQVEIANNGSAQVSIDSTSYVKVLDNSGTANATIYIGKAAPGTAVTAAAWTIQSLGYDGNGNLSSLLWGSVAGGTPSSTLIWNNRASYTYS